MRQILLNLIEKIPSLSSARIIPGAAPIPSFGDHTQSKVATLGLNPSDREFFGKNKKELEEPKRRFHTINSLGISGWAEVKEDDLQKIQELCREYFLPSRNPYKQWFNPLNELIKGTQNSYFDRTNQACHLDLVPYATECKWSDLTKDQQKLLLETCKDTLGLLLRESPIRLLILNGKTVVKNFQEISDVIFEEKDVYEWTLFKKRGKNVLGRSYKGIVKKVSGIEMSQDLLVLGFNHSIPRAPRTKQVKEAMSEWIKSNSSYI